MSPITDRGTPVTVDWSGCTRRALRYVWPYWPLGLGAVVAMLLLTGLALLTPWPMKIVVDSVLQNEPLPGVLQPIAGGVFGDKVLLLILTALSGLAISLIIDGVSVVSAYLSTRLNLGMTLDFRSDLFQHSQRMSMAFHDQKQSGMLIYVINSMADAPTNLVLTLLPLVQNALTLVGMFWISFRISPVLALAALSIVPFVYYSIGYYTKHIRTRLRDVKLMEGETLSIIHEAISMLRVIVAFGREDHEFQRFRDQGERANRARVDVTVRQALFSMVVNATISGGTALVLGLGAYLALSGTITVGELLVVLAYIAAVYRPLEAISGTIGALQDHYISLQMAFDVLEKEPERDSPGAIELHSTRGHVVFDQVSFNHDGRVGTLKHLSFELPPGQVTAIVGPTGAGKSTLVSLIPRYYQAKQGRITIDGVDIRDVKRKSLREQISLVLQESLLFSSTIAENIHYGRLDATEAEIVEAAKAANAHDFIMALPHKYKTVVGERGAQLSGGERQRIGIARAFLRNAPILILDEPTSSIDVRTEGVILEALDRLMAGRTTLFVTHRLSTLRHASRIYVLNHGEIIERGTHDELLAAGGLYRQLHDMQAGRQRPRLAAPSAPSISATAAG
jgi:ABC-type multidrug transport system fused ATPase/permease subunit